MVEHKVLVLIVVALHLELVDVPHLHSLLELGIFTVERTLTRGAFALRSERRRVLLVLHNIRLVVAEFLREGLLPFLLLLHIDLAIIYILLDLLSELLLSE